MMKHHFLKIICASLALCSVLTFTACGNEKKESSSSATSAASSTPSEASAATAATAAAATADEKTTADASKLKKETDLSKLHPFAQPGDMFTGCWKITDGFGSQYSHFTYAFDGNKNAYLLVGTMAYNGVYEIHNKDGKDVFTTQLMFGLNGDYTYDFSKDKQSVVLTDVDTNDTTTLTKTESYNSIPKAPDDPKIDEALLGAWADDTGEYLYFGRDGIMYKTQKSINYTFYTYSAEKGVVTATYNMLKDTEETAAYSLKGDVLLYDSYEYHRISADELP